MSKDKEIVYPVRFSKLDMSDLDGLRKREDDLPSRAEMVRRLVARASGRAVAAEKPKRKRLRKSPPDTDRIPV